MFKIIVGLMKGISSFYFYNCTFYVKSKIYFFDDSLNHDYAILNNIITNIYIIVL